MITALQLQEAGINCIGVPKTIDNDLEATAMTFGFDSAVATVMDALDRLHTTATSHKRVMVRRSDGASCGLDRVPRRNRRRRRYNFDSRNPVRLRQDRRRDPETRRRRSVSALLSLSPKVREPRDGQQVMREMEAGEYRLGGIGDIVAREIAARTGKETRSCVLGHLQRGGAPTTLDRILGTRFGVKAVQLINEKQFGSMVSYQNYQVRHVPIADAVNRLRLVPPDGEMVCTARDVEISFGD